MTKRFLHTLICASLWGAHGFAADIPLVGLSADGVPVEVLVPRATYQKNLKTAVVAIQTTALPVLQKRSGKASGWMLRSAVFGLGVSPEVGIGELKFGFLPRFRVGFSNAKEPSIP
jgi:hypothetical protein